MEEKKKNENEREKSNKYNKLGEKKKNVFCIFLVLSIFQGFKSSDPIGFGLLRKKK